MQNLIEVARLGKAVGLKGELRLNLSSDFPEQFQHNAVFHLNNKKQLTVEYYLPERGLIKFKEIHTREEAQNHTNLYIYTTKEQTRDDCSLEEGEYFWFDVEGCTIIEEDTILGKVTEIQRLGNLDYLLVETDKSLQKSHKAKNFLIPYIERYVLETDIEQKIILVQGALDILDES